MSQYTPIPAPLDSDIDGLKRWMENELNNIARCASEANDVAKLKVLYAAPTKFAPGDLIYADGVTYNPGSGEGVYRRNLANTAWNFLG